VAINGLMVNILSLKEQWSVGQIDIFYKYAVPKGTMEHDAD
jgi:hypothetical protein